MNKYKETWSRITLVSLVILMQFTLVTCNLDILQKLTAAEISVVLEGTEISEGGTYNFGTVFCNESLDLSCTIRNNGASDLSLESAPLRVLISGTNAGLFSIDHQPPAVIKPGDTAKFTINFISATAGIKNVQFEIPNSDENEGSFSFTISGNAVLTPEPDISVRTSVTITNGESNFSIGSTIVGTPLQMVFYIDNEGTVDLNLTGNPTVELGSSTVFSITDEPNNSVIAPEATDSFTVEYDPVSDGTNTVSVTIANDDADENPFAFTIEASSTLAPVPDISIRQDVNPISQGTGSYAFSNVLLGSSSSAVVFTIENPGTAALNLTGNPRVVLGGTNPSEFNVDPQPASSVAESGSTTFSITFTPASAGAKSATASIDNNVPGRNPYTFTITGTGVAPEINIKQDTNNIASGGSYDFDDLAVNTVGTPVTYTIENQGAAVLNLTGNPRVNVGGTDASMFTVTSQPPSTVSASGSTTFNVSFNPTSIGAKSATLSIANDDGNENPYVINISGDSMPWVRTYAGTGYDWMPSMVQTSDGGFAMIGFSDISGNYDYWVVKAASDGSIDWQRAFGGTETESPMVIKQTSDGGYIVGGYTANSFGAGGNDAWILKLTSTGTVTWQNTYGTTSHENIYDIVQADDGGYVAMGYSGGAIHNMKLSSSGIITWQKWYNGASIDSPQNIILREPDKDYIVVGNTLSWGAGGNDIWVFRMTKTGLVYANTYNKAYGGTGDDQSRNIIQTADGGYLVVGYTDSYGTGLKDGWILKLTGMLAVSWQKAYGGSDDEIISDIKQTSDGGYIAVGETESFGGGYADVLVLKLASDGSIEWQKTYGGSGTDRGKHVYLAPNGGYFIGGDTYSFGTGNNKANMLLMHLDTNGDPVYSNLGENLSLGQNTVITVTTTTATVTDTNPADDNFEQIIANYGTTTPTYTTTNTAVTPITHYP